MDKSILTDLIGEVVGIYPGDTYYKFGIIRRVDDLGVLIEVTKAHPSSDYKPGDMRFISHNNKLTLKLVGGDINDNN